MEDYKFTFALQRKGGNKGLKYGNEMLSANFYPTVKPLIDGMTDANMWTDDNAEVVQSVKFELGEVTDDKKYHLDILIKGVEKMKVKIFSNLFISDLEKEITDFIKGKKIKDIKGLPRKDYTAVLVMYEEE